jgi:hypothetical protein
MGNMGKRAIWWRIRRNFHYSIGLLGYIQLGVALACAAFVVILFQLFAGVDAVAPLDVVLMAAFLVMALAAFDPWISHLARARRMAGCWNPLCAALWAIRNGDLATRMGYVLLIFAFLLAASLPKHTALFLALIYFSGVIAASGYLGRARYLPSRRITSWPSVSDGVLAILFTLFVAGVYVGPQDVHVKILFVLGAIPPLVAFSAGGHWKRNRTERRLRLRRVMEREV